MRAIHTSSAPRASARRGARARRRAKRGYTIVEVMMALCVLAVGGMGIVALQKFAAIGAVSSRSMTSASDVANSWVEFLQAEATKWNRPDNSDIVEAPLLNLALSNGNVGNWTTIPTNVAFGTPDGGATRVFGDNKPTPDIHFCSQIRATWLGAKDQPATQAGQALAISAKPSDVVRVEVRTWYAKTGRPINAECAVWTAAAVTNMLNTPDSGLSDGAVIRSRHEYGFVYASGTVRRNTLQ
ncbi:MAG: hypothetical protein U0414_34400 [Polyangiaceae bacterium]